MSGAPTADTTVSVIICAYTDKRWQPLVEAIEGARAQTRPAEQVVVVIDHNDDLLARVRERFTPLGVIVTANPGQRGISGARNHGVAESSGEIVVFLDDDATPYPDWLAHLTKHYADPGIYGVGGGLVARWETGQQPRWIPQEFYWTLSCNYRGLPTTQAPVRNLIGGNMSVRRSAFVALGGLQNGLGRLGTIPLGCEDTEFCIRLRRHYPAAILLHEPDALVSHLATATRTRPRYFLTRCWDEGRSKAIVARLVGTTAGLASERYYTFFILPTGILLHLGAVVRHGDIAGVGRAAMIVAGLALTTGGYLRGRLSMLGGRFQLAPTIPTNPPTGGDTTAIDARS